MSLKNLWKEKKGPTISFELFPGRDEKAAKKLLKVIDNLAALQPDFVSVTFGAGGTNRKGSFDLVQTCLKEKNLKVLPYVAGYGLSPKDINSIFDNYRELELEAFFCIRGDKPMEPSDFEPHPESFAYASDFITYVNDEYDVFTGAAGYPEGHVEAESKEKDLEYLKLKVDKGARFIIAQYTYDNRHFFDFVKRCRAIGISVPILAGVMPIYSIKMTENLASVCGASIPPMIKEEFAQLPPDDKKAVTAFGIDIATRQCRELLAKGVDGLHFFTMDKSKTVVEVITALRSEGLL
ncbi:MAG: 5,10-methylenetetrahydrofolate reductase [bacterium]|nr:5,10-methylenetetrahydrofolate reductase [bacterium]